uniref:Uncharacterized protein n=1 Tax=Panagrolaimus sp. JU765 TaxID=591449 RepID=A0AC34RC46_9BILA
MEALLDEFLLTSTPENWSLVDLFDFDHPAFNPEQNSFKVSVLWRQRILCQTIPVFIKYFSRLSKTDEVRRSIYLEALSPILASANKLKVSIAIELLALFPVLTEALQSLSQTKNATVLDLILS